MNDTPCGREGCDFALWAMNFIYRLAAALVGLLQMIGGALFFIKPYNRPSGEGKAFPPLVAGATTFPSAEAVGQ